MIRSPGRVLELHLQVIFTASSVTRDATHTSREKISFPIQVNVSKCILLLLQINMSNAFSMSTG
jgi:hypothetical protein